MLRRALRRLNTVAAPTVPSEKKVKFRTLAQFIKTKTTVDEAQVRELILGEQFKPLRFLGKVNSVLCPLTL
jgi:hypothetical protein